MVSIIKSSLNSNNGFPILFVIIINSKGKLLFKKNFKQDLISDDQLYIGLMRIITSKSNIFHNDDLVWNKFRFIIIPYKNFISCFVLKENTNHINYIDKISGFVSLIEGKYKVSQSKNNKDFLDIGVIEECLLSF